MRHLVLPALLLCAAGCGGEGAPEQIDGQRSVAPSAEAEAQIREVKALLSRGLGEEALRRAREIQAAYPQVPDAHLLVGDALGTRGDFAAAAQEYRKAADLSLTEPVAMRLAEALRRSSQGAAAAKLLQHFLGRNPDSVQAMALAASLFMEEGKWAQAIRLYERVRRRSGDGDAVLLNNLAWAYMEQGEFDRAIPLAEKAWNLDKGNPAMADTLGWLLFQSGRDKARGLALLEEAARASPGDGQIQGHLQAARRG